ncbi:hypothetical protein [Sphingomonas sp. DBB INV C78]|uniref:hypothetical protein n=1 Tax=Sphingomonas sp. DBB INV C78 TaxID=3349434 RepID=UPI0036D28032
MAVLILSASVPALAEDKDFDPSTIRLEEAIACKLDVRTYNGFAFWLVGSDDGAGTLGWKKIEGGNPMLAEYRLPQPIKAFGTTTDRIALASSGVLAVLPGLPAAEVARALNVENAFPGGAKFLGERIVDEKVVDDADLGMRFTYIVAHSVSTVDSHPGATLAGCCYRVEQSER